MLLEAVRWTILDIVPLQLHAGTRHASLLMLICDMNCITLPTLHPAGWWMLLLVGCRVPWPVPAYHVVLEVIGVTEVHRAAC